MNDDELDLWLRIHNEQFDAQINAKVDVGLRRQQVRAATASVPHDGEPDLAEVRATWSEQADPTGPRSRRGRSASIRPTKRSSTHPGPSGSVPRCRRKIADATRSLAIILVVLFLLVSSAVVGDFANHWGAAPPPRERGKNMVIGIPANARGLGIMQESHRYGFAYDLANWLADDLHYSPKTFYSFPDIDVVPDYRQEMLRTGQVDMIVAPDPITDQRGMELLFAGPYLITRGGVLTRADNTAIRAIGDLDGKRVCTWDESTYKEQSKRLGTTVEKDDLLSCVDALTAGSVDAVAGDQLLLSEIAEAEEGNELSVVPGLSFGGQQRYGIELERGDVSECNEIRDAIRRFITSGAWDHAFRANMPDGPPVALKPDPDHLDRCE